MAKDQALLVRSIQNNGDGWGSDGSMAIDKKAVICIAFFYTAIISISFVSHNMPNAPIRRTMTEVKMQSVKDIHKRIGRLERHQIEAWRKMSPDQRLEIAFQAYQFALDAVRLTERNRHPDLPEDQFNWRVTRRMQGDQN